jgi:predicted ATP-binding protein involved in virulence
MINALNNNGLDTMKVTSLELKDVGGIPYLKLEEINPRMNIICGENGVGKTTVLESIGHIFTNQHTATLKKKINSENALIVAFVLDDYGNMRNPQIALYEHEPQKTFHIPGLGAYSKKLLSFKVDRTFTYQRIDAIRKDEDKNEHHTSQQSITGINYHDIKTWFIHRHLYSVHPQALEKEQLENFNFAKRCFSILNHNFKFSRVDPNENEIMINTPSGEIYYEYLSSGFKSTISIVFGIIKEIEMRFKTPYMIAQDFDGIILIDEIELHLHPEWQGQICSVLKEVFPKAQFFISTHSPHVVQTALKDEVIALERRNNEVVRRELPTSEYGYQGWTIEEILEDVMGMPDLRTQKYNEVKIRFDDALDSKNKQEALLAFNELEKMLHPNYPLKPVFKIQLDSLGD